jgi:hypothetical protein
MTQTSNPVDQAYAQAEQNADLASQLLWAASQADGYRRQRLIEEAKVLVAAVKDWITPESPEEAHTALRELNNVLAQFEVESKPN